jgi:hypothetical protein
MAANGAWKYIPDPWLTSRKIRNLKQHNRGSSQVAEYFTRLQLSSPIGENRRDSKVVEVKLRVNDRVDSEGAATGVICFA